MNRKRLLVSVISLILLVAAGVLLLKGVSWYLLHLLENPDDSYVSAWLQKHRLKNPVLHTTSYYVEYVPAMLLRVLLAGAGMLMTVGLLLTRWKGDLRRFWNHQSTAFNLGALRILVLSQVIATGLDANRALCAMPVGALNPPVGYGWLKPFLPPSPQFVDASMTIYQVLCWMALAGLFTRWTLPVLTFVAFWVQLGPQLLGKVDHYHHLWLGLAILSASPCGRALSVDSLLRRWKGERIDPHASGVVYGRPFVWLWCIMGAAYFFAGFWKFAAGGTAWVTSDNVQLKILAKVFETGREPFLPLYRYPLLCKLGGFATIAFEMAFPLAMIFPRWRALFAIGGVVFHEINALVMQIRFTSMERLYLSFIHWSWLIQRFRPLRAAPAEVTPAWKNKLGAVLAGGLLVTGCLAIDSWPWSMYPTFGAIEQKFVNSIEMRIIGADGKELRRTLLIEETHLVEAFSNRTRLRAHMTQVLRQHEPEARREKLHALFETWRRGQSIPEGASVEFWHVFVPLLPVDSPPEPYCRLEVIP